MRTKNEPALFREALQAYFRHLPPSSAKGWWRPIPIPIRLKPGVVQRLPKILKA